MSDVMELAGVVASGAASDDAPESRTDGGVTAAEAHKLADRAHALAVRAHELVAEMRRQFDHEVAAIRGFLKIPHSVPADRLGDVVTAPDAGKALDAGPGRLVAGDEIGAANGTGSIDQSGQGVVS